ncbi:MAG: ABC-2 type transport system permease protein [Chlamydiales bacterium]|jgi:ABC-2 type transport system permease protein
MQEMFRAQIRQILGGRMKWLMAVCLLLPVLLTFGAVTSGGLGEIRDEIQEEQTVNRAAAGVFSADTRPILWSGQDEEFAGGKIILTEEGVHYETRRHNGREWKTHRGPIDDDMVLVVNRGYLIVRDGELWTDESLKPSGNNWHIQHRNHRDSVRPELAVVDVTVRSVCAGYLFILYPQVICLLLALLYGTSVLGSELDGKTLPYLFSRPLPRWHFVVGKYLGIVASLAIPTAISLTASWMILGFSSDISLLIGILAGAIGALFAYNAVFIFFGFLTPRRAMIVALIYGILFELILSFVPALINQITVTYYLRSLVVEILDLQVPREMARVVGGASLPFALAALLAIIVVTLGASSVMAAQHEYVVKDEA